MRFDTGIGAAATMCVLLVACGSGPAAGSGAGVIDDGEDATSEADDTDAAAESGTAWLDFGRGSVGSAGNTVGGGSMDDYRGVIPAPVDDTGETFPDGTVSGNACIPADTDQLEGATIRIEESFSFDDTRAFFALT